MLVQASQRPAGAQVRRPLVVCSPSRDGVDFGLAWPAECPFCELCELCESGFPTFSGVVRVHTAVFLCESAPSLTTHPALRSAGALRLRMVVTAPRILRPVARRFLRCELVEQLG